LSLKTQQSDPFTAIWVPEKTLLSKELGVTEATSNGPTFSLVNEYQTNDNQIVYHFDFYRVNETEALDMGWMNIYILDTGALSVGGKHQT
jgi:tRNA A37 threonylcarbamoyladenosine biosynthesis protein TsaE